MPDFKPVKSRVLAAGTAMLLSTMLAHAVFEASAEAASVKVQLGARVSMSGPGAGNAETVAAPALSKE